MLKQCAWCLINLDTLEPMVEKILDASHGICGKCADKVRQIMGVK